MIALPIGTAGAGPCTTEIESLSKILASKDAGSGPTAGGQSTMSQSANPAGQHPPTAAMSEAVKGQASSPEDVRRQTAGQSPASDQSGARSVHPPTAAMNEAQATQTAPTASGERHPPTAAVSEQLKGQNPPQAGSAGDAASSLALARDFDKQGKEADCMKAIDDAKRASAR
jgi:hypothetical protein